MEQLFWRKDNERCERTERPLQPKQAPAPAQQAPAPAPAPAPAQQAPAPAPAQQAPAPAPATQAHQVIADHGFRKVSNKREEANAKINNRYLIGQANQNPFMLSNNYVNDIEVQMNFLTPQRSSN